MKKNIKIMLAILIIVSNIMGTNFVFADDTVDDDDPINNITDQDCITQGGNIPKISAGAAIIMDAESGRVLFEKNAYSRKSIASTTKIMTAIVVIENCSDNEDVVISKRAAKISGSTVGLKEGKTYKLGDLLYAMMLRSGNDAAIALAEHVGGSVEAFAEMMNRKAAELGATNTNFVTPHGLDDPQHYSTAYDLALITQYAIKNSKFSQIVSTKSSTFAGSNIHNTNEMLSLYPGADGVKTGYTGLAGRCLVTTATHNGFRIISVTLYCASRTARAQSSKAILDYAFANFKQQEYLRQNQEICDIKIKKGIQDKTVVCAESEIHIPLKSDEIDRLQIKYNIPKIVDAPVLAGSIMGTIEYVLDGKILASTSVKAQNDVERKDFYYYFDNIFKTWGRLLNQG